MTICSELETFVVFLVYQLSVLTFTFVIIISLIYFCTGIQWIWLHWSAVLVPINDRINREEPQIPSNTYYLRSSNSNMTTASGITPLTTLSDSAPLRFERDGEEIESESTLSVDASTAERAMTEQPPAWLAHMLQSMQEQNSKLLDVLCTKAVKEEKERKDIHTQLQKEMLEAGRREKEWKELEQKRWEDNEERERARIIKEELRDKEKEIERRIEKFPHMKEGENVELYLQSFENELEQAGVAKEKWKSLITVRLTPKVKQFVGNLQRDPQAGYTEIKTRILIKAGITSAEAGQQFFNSTLDGMRGKSSGEYLQHL